MNIYVFLEFMQNISISALKFVAKKNIRASTGAD